MGKKNAKKRTIWKSLPLTTEEGGDCSEDDVSTTSSGRSPGLVLRMRNGYRHRHLSDREPLVKLESKTFDEEEYTKITTPRQDVLFKKGYFARRKLESSTEEGIYPVHEGDEEQMEQMIITNGFVDERGHYLMNGNSYEIYDPYTNTVTVVVGPPPYTNGITPPVLAAVSCQPVPLQPVDWYPPGGGEWPPGPAWTPAYPKQENVEDSPGSEEAAPNMFPPQPFVFQNLIYPLPIDITVDEHAVHDGVPKDDAPNQPGQENAPEEKETRQTVPSSTPLKPTVEEFIPSCLKPAPAFAPRVLKPAAEFVPQSMQNGTASSLRPNGAVFVPKHHQRPPQPAPEHPRPQPQEATISTAPPRIAPPAETPRKEEQALPTVPPPQIPKEKPVAATAKIPPKANETEKAKETVLQRPARVSPPPGDGNVSTEPPKEMLKTTAADSARVESAPKTDSHGTQTPKEPEHLSPQPSPRRSYAKTVSTGLDQVLNNEQTPTSQLDKDNKLGDKRVVQNGAVLTNGHDERMQNGSAKIARNGKDIKRANNVNGQDKRDGENGFYRHNGSSPHRYQKERINNGEKGARKEAKEVFNGRKPETNGFNGKIKEPMHNGGYAVKEKITNGKERNGNRKPAVPEKKMEAVRTENRVVSSQISQSDDSDDKSDTFRPVENRRNRAQVNGVGKNKQPLRIERPEKEPEEPMEDSIIESKPVLERLDTTISVKTESEKSSTLSELSSPTDLSSGQNTPPETASLLEDHASDLNKSAEKLLEGLNEKKKKSKKAKKSPAVQRSEPKEEKVEEVAEELPPLPDFLQLPKDDIMDLDLSAALDHALLRSLRQSEPAISKVNLFPPRTPTFPLDLYTKTNLSQMRATRPEEFFASIVDTPVPGEFIRPAEKPRRVEKLAKPQLDMRTGLRKPMNTAYKPSRKPSVKEEEAEKSSEAGEKQEASQEAKLGIVDAVKTWLETQDGALAPTESPTPEPEEDSKNVKGDPSRASSVEGEDVACLRVAKETSPDLSALTDARASVDKYYSLSARRLSTSEASEVSAVSEQEAVDALEYAFPRPPTIAPCSAQFPTKDLACKLQ